MSVVDLLHYAVTAMTKDELLSEIHKYVATHKRSPGEREFCAVTRIKESAWKGKFWARWTDAVREAGYKPNSLQQRIPDADVLEQLSKFVLQLGHFPILDEINMQARRTPGFPVWQTIRKRYGGMPETAAALLKFSRETGNERLATLCEARIALEARKPAAIPNRKPHAKQKTGVVYLKYSPSLRLYKIGKADDGQKRGAGISLLLPADLVSKHEIRTDCPYILEKYWHDRFRSKRRQGEWFDLTKSDIEAFKHRREFLFCELFP
jgi:Meiotically Up-regulated Gene 113 (MUG113) protein